MPWGWSDQFAPSRTRLRSIIRGRARRASFASRFAALCLRLNPLRDRCSIADRSRIRAAHHHLASAAQPARHRARPALLSLRRSRPQCRLRGRRRSRPQLRARREDRSRRRERLLHSVRQQSVALLLGAGQHLCAARHALVLLAFARPGGRDGVSHLPRGLRRPFQLGPDMVAYRLQRPWFRCLCHRREPGPDAHLV